MKLDLDHPIAGVLVPIFALRGAGDLGIGDAVSLMEFTDWAAEVGFRLVKMLPISETGGDNSPYNAISSRSLDPTTIRTTPEHLPDLRADEFEQALSEVDRQKLDGTIVDYDVVKPLKQRLLEAAFERFRRNHLSTHTARAQAFEAFQREQAEWLDEYTLFRVLLDEHSERWDKWPEEHRTPAAAQAWAAALHTRQAQALAKRRLFYTYVQWIAFQQWRAAKAHAASRGVALMGDIPFGVSYQSADVWACPQLFRTGWCLSLIHI